MSEAIHGAPQEFWRPPILHSEGSNETLAEACDHCGSEFIVGARFCHVCGATRPLKGAKSGERRWTESLEFLKALEFQRVKAAIGLPSASLIAFLAGAACVLAAIIVGILFSVQNLADFQAIQLWRIEWLLAALVAFVAGILLKRNEPAEK